MYKLSKYHFKYNFILWFSHMYTCTDYLYSVRQPTNNQTHRTTWDNPDCDNYLVASLPMQWKKTYRCYQSIAKSLPSGSLLRLSRMSLKFTKRRAYVNIVNKLYLEYQAESVFFQVNIIDVFKPTPIFLINGFKTIFFNSAKINSTFYKVPRQYLQKCVFLPLVDLHKVRIHVKTCRL